MFQKILVLCTGNICRSPLGEARLRQVVVANGRDIEVRSAGFGALVGHSADSSALVVAETRGLDVSDHVARQLTPDLIRWADLILVMEHAQRSYLIEQLPTVSGKVLLFGHWIGEEIPDPYMEDLDVFEDTMDLIDLAAVEWGKRL